METGKNRYWLELIRVRIDPGQNKSGLLSSSFGREQATVGTGGRTPA
jgi:hypothetical protein